jgi:hypothetical protein
MDLENFNRGIYMKKSFDKDLALTMAFVITITLLMGQFAEAKTARVASVRKPSNVSSTSISSPVQSSLSSPDSASIPSFAQLSQQFSQWTQPPLGAAVAAAPDLSQLQAQLTGLTTCIQQAMPTQAQFDALAQACQADFTAAGSSATVSSGQAPQLSPACATQFADLQGLAQSFVSCVTSQSSSFTSLVKQ